MEFALNLLKKVNHISKGKKMLTEEDFTDQRYMMERVAGLASQNLGVHTEDLMIHDVPAQWHIPNVSHSKKTIVLYTHGGGYTAGGIKYSGLIASKLAHLGCIDVLSYAYRLAPEYPYPAQKQDAIKVWDYLMHMGYGAENVIVAGDSAGGNLTLCLVQALQKQGRMLPKGIVLFSPWTDMTGNSSSYKEHEEDDPVVSYDYVMTCRHAYIHGSEQMTETSYANPIYSPLYGSFDNFPPTYIQAGRHEVLLDDSRRLLERLKTSGVRSELKIFEDGWHVFQQMPIPMASTALYEAAEFIHSL